MTEAIMFAVFCRTKKKKEVVPPKRKDFWDVGQKSSFSLVLKNESPLPFFQKFYFSQRGPPPIHYYSKTMWNWLRKQLEATAQSFFPIFYGWRRGVIASSKSFQSSVWVKARFFWFEMSVDIAFVSALDYLVFRGRLSKLNSKVLKK